METKVELRSQFQSLRRDFHGRVRREADSALSANLRRLLGDLQTPDLQICLYRARRDEAPCELAPLTDYFFPRLNRDDMEFYRPLRADAFETSQWQIKEPIPASSRLLDPHRPILVCCPALAVDRYGHRLGMGRAYYDRFFNLHPDALRVGVIYHFQLASESLPQESWDATLDWLVTDKMILRIQEGVRDHGSRRNR